MKEEDASILTPQTNNMTNTKRESNDVSNKGHYKFWVLAAIILLALWSMFTGSVNLKWSAGNLNHSSHDLDSTTFDDLDVLEVEEREKVVRRMWDVYTHSTTTRLTRFWSDAFHAAYEHLVSDVPGIRDAAVLEIAKMSFHSLNFQHLPLQLHSHSHEQNIKGSRKMKQPESSMDTRVVRNQ